MINRQQLRQQTAVALYNARPYYLKQADSEWGESLLKAGKSFTDAMGPSFQPVVDFTRDVGDKMPFLRATHLGDEGLPSSEALGWELPPRYPKPIKGDTGYQSIKLPTKIDSIDIKGDENLRNALVAQGFTPTEDNPDVYIGTVIPKVFSQGGQSILGGVQEGMTNKWGIPRTPEKAKSKATENIQGNIEKDIEGLDFFQKYIAGPQMYMKNIHKDAMGLFEQAQILKAAGDIEGAEEAMRQYKILYDTYNTAKTKINERYSPFRTGATGAIGLLGILYLLSRLFGAK